ncbi:MAG: universal stress protein [Flavobacteriales bacterium]|nr:universal stress protein [Flavobacteriales bacterium]
MKNILVTIEFEDQSDVLMEKATEIAAKYGAKVWLVHVAAPEPDFVGYGTGPQYIRDTLAQDLREEHRILQKYADEMKNNGVEAEGLLVQGSTVETIITESEKLNIDMIVIGHHKRSFLYHLFMTGTDESLIEQSNIPVLTIPLN